MTMTRLDSEHPGGAHEPGWKGPFLNHRFELPTGMHVTFYDEVSADWDEAEAYVVESYRAAEPLVAITKEMADKIGCSVVELLQRAHAIAVFEQERAELDQQQ